jgi:hypothetical protein
MRKVFADSLVDFLGGRMVLRARQDRGYRKPLRRNPNPQLSELSDQIALIHDLKEF